jgi:hypothetical protein
MIYEKIYWLVDYRESLNSDYVNNADIKISDNEIKLIEKEVDCLKKHNIKSNSNYIEYGLIIVEDKIKKNEDIYKTYKLKDLVPYIKTKPVQYLIIDNDFNNLTYDNQIKIG